MLKNQMMMAAMAWVVWTVLMTHSVTVIAQNTLQDTIVSYFEEARMATAGSKKFWGKDISGPMLIVNPSTRMAYAPQSDTAGVLKADGKIFSGVLPMGVPIANASQHWNGVHWAMIMLPFIPKDPHARANLFAHELFHRAQGSLGFIPRDANNAHLDQKDGRIYLRLELAALERALQAADKAKCKEHIRDALTFRKCRFQQYPGADSAENSLDINEGIAEYTGVMLSGRNPQAMTAHFIQKNQELMAGASFVRSFSYRNIPIYGYLLRQWKKDWHREIRQDTRLTDYFVQAFRLHLPPNAVAAAAVIQTQYGGEKIVLEENARVAEIAARTAKYKALFVDGPHLVIPFQKKRVAFDTRTIFTLVDLGTVYPVMEASDVWGLLKVERVGGLMSANGSKVVLTPPVAVEGNVVTGDGWKLTLNQGFEVEKDEVSGNWELRKKGE